MKFNSSGREFDTDEIKNGTISNWMLAFKAKGTDWEIPLWEFSEATIKEMKKFFTIKERK